MISTTIVAEILNTKKKRERAAPHLLPQGQDHTQDHLHPIIRVKGQLRRGQDQYQILRSRKKSRKSRKLNHTTTLEPLHKNKSLQLHLICKLMI